MTPITKSEEIATKNTAEWVHALSGMIQAQNEIRRGICLLNAGSYNEAADAFSRAQKHGSGHHSLPAYLAACYLGQGKPDQSAQQFAHDVDTNEANTTARIRHALSWWEAGNPEAAIQSLRDGINLDMDNAELHFQLGTLLTRLDRIDEAELRFVQALSINREHVEAMISIALCYGIHGAPDKALPHLEKAQGLKPYDARIGQLLVQTARAIRQMGLNANVQAQMPANETLEDEKGIEELSNIIQTDPDFVDAFISISMGDIEVPVFSTLLNTLEKALERQPEQAELHFHCGRVLERLGRHSDAIQKNEQAVTIDPTHTRALIELAKLYQKTDRNKDATTRLEQAVAAGAEYADVYCLLGHLYRDQGQIERARDAYRHALSINRSYEAAHEALVELGK